MAAVNILAFATVMLIGLITIPVYSTLQDWPKECENKTICHFRSKDYPQPKFAKLLKGQNFSFVQGDPITNRSSEGVGADVAGCIPLTTFGKVYLIRDEQNRIRYVAQNENAYSVEVGVEGCQKPGPTSGTILDTDVVQVYQEYEDKQVYCYETRIPFQFIVLTLDGNALESVAPKNGLSVSCSGKVTKKN